GAKPANLIGSLGEDGNSNLAIFSSVVHLGSNPPFLGIITRPEFEVSRHTLENIRSKKFYSINSVPNSKIKQAHYTSAKFPKGISEFDQCDFQEEYIDEFPIPFVKSASIKIGMSLSEEIHIKSNNTLLLVGRVELIVIKDYFETAENGMINLEQLNLVAIGGLNAYYSLKEIERLPYARVSDWKK
ncbi:MAG: flavin reductase, partial [Bacteroidota bacterium]